LGDEIEIRPGFTEKKEGQYVCTPIKSKIVTLLAE